MLVASCDNWSGFSLIAYGMISEHNFRRIANLETRKTELFGKINENSSEFHESLIVHEVNRINDELNYRRILP